MVEKNIKLLIVDDKQENITLISDELMLAFPDGGEKVLSITSETSFDAGERRAASEFFDLIILDVRKDKTQDLEEDPQMGEFAFKRIRSSKFVPIIFWTAIPEQVKYYEISPFIQVFEKGATSEIPAAIERALEAEAATAMHEIEKQVTDNLREFLWDEVAPNWSEYVSVEKRSFLPGALVARLANQLQRTDDQLISLHPGLRYLYPPVSEIKSPGDILKITKDNSDEWWIILTPSCDLAHDKVQHILLSRARPLVEQAAFVSWLDKNDEGIPGKNKNSESSWRKIKEQLGDKNKQYYYLPKFRDIPHLVADLNELQIISSDELKKKTSIATLVSPFSEALIAQFSHYRGRIGVSDHDFNRLRIELESEHLVP